MSLRIGLTAEKTCSYLPDQRDRLAVVMDPEWHNTSAYRLLMDHGFRRSSDMIYRPHCHHCDACQPIRVDTQLFRPSKSQKRLLKHLPRYQIEMKDRLDSDWFPLYRHYITKRHSTGSMYPPNARDFYQFVNADWINVSFLHLYQDNKLVGIAVCDIFDDAMSAVYTFFDPDQSISMGSLAILAQISYCQQREFNWLYLGFQVDDCTAMNYKNRYQPCQRWRAGEWHNETRP